MPEYTHTLLATLGGQPQVVTFTLDLLLQRGFPISEVIVIHPHPVQPRLLHALACLNAEFAGDRYSGNHAHAPRTIHLRSHMLRLDEALLDDITEDISANGALDTIHQLIRDLKRQPRCIHLSVTGGRRLMALTALSAAQLNFKHNIDHIWHIYTPDELADRASEGRLMHASPDAPTEQVNLIELPFVPWRTYFAPQSDAGEAGARAMLHSQVMEAEDFKRCRAVEHALTKAQRRVLVIFSQGKSRKEATDQLCLSPSTISTHLTRILVECRIAWDIPEQRLLDYHYLREHFAGYFLQSE